MDYQSILPHYGNKEEQNKQIKVLAIGDSIDIPTGVGNMSRLILTSMVKQKKWKVFQLGGAENNPNPNQRVIDGVTIIPVRGYGNKQQILSSIQQFKPDVLWIMTDPRYYEELFMVRNQIKIPIVWYIIWDEKPIPMYNKGYFESVDAFTCISQNSVDVVKGVLDEKEHHKVFYVPHGVENDENGFMPFEDEFIYEERKKFIENFKLNTTPEKMFMVYWNNKNLIRKRPTDVMKSVYEFAKKTNNLDNVVLVMKTQPQTPPGTNLWKYHFDHVKDLKIVILKHFFSRKQLNVFSNLSNVAINLSSNEGWGLNLTEALMSGKPIVSLATGGMKDQILEPINVDGVELKTTYCTEPAGRMMKGSCLTPYIYDYASDTNKVIEALEDVFNNRDIYDKFNVRTLIYNKAFEKFNVSQMIQGNINAIEYALKHYEQRKPFRLIKMSEVC